MLAQEDVGGLAVLLVALLGGVTLGVAAALRRARHGGATGLLDLGLVSLSLLWGSAWGTLLAQRLATGSWHIEGEPPLLALLAGSAVGSATGAGFSLWLAGARGLGLDRPAPVWVLRGLALWPVFLCVTVLWSLALEGAGLVVEEQELLGLLREVWGTAAGGAVLVWAVLGAPLTEEILFRGLALRALVPRVGRALAVGLTAVVFGLLHGGDPQSVPPLVVLGLALGWLRLASGSLWPPVALHLANNALALATVLFGGA